MVAPARGLKIRDLVKRPPITIPQNASLLEAADVMAKNNIGALLVTDSTGSPVAVLSERDIVKAISMRIPLSTPVEAFMSTTMITVNADDSVEKAAELMWINNIRHLVVVEGGRAIGIISIRDLINPRVLRHLREHG
ncbi:MAG: CBS domain-containing protein [Pyrobaculum sp.]|uniref:CBS domain-containing protein n=1 Tax=Pyrobaculum sp. TaxID=2004705 RepID=UPI00316F0A09